MCLFFFFFFFFIVYCLLFIFGVGMNILIIYSSFKVNATGGVGF